MSNKKFVKMYLVFVGILLALCVCAVVLVDPFGFYHKPWFGLKNVNLNQVYQNPGYVKNYDYKTALVGTSMVEGMRASEVDEIFSTSTIKICESGSLSMDMAEMLRLVCEEGKASTIITSFDANFFRKDYDTYRSEMPLYLYNDNPFDDVEYVLNKQIIFDYIPKVRKANIAGNLPELDDYYIVSESEHSKDNALANYNGGVLEAVYSSWDNAEFNIENIRPVIEENQDVDFYIFMPPYSMLFWNVYAANGVIDNELEMQKKIVEAFISYDNVKFFYFMDDYDIVTNLDNYRDPAHYSPAVCSEILKKIYEGEHLLTEDNYLQVFEDMRSFVSDYNYEQLFLEE